MPKHTSFRETHIPEGALQLTLEEISKAWETFVSKLLLSHTTYTIYTSENHVKP